MHPDTLLTKLNGVGKTRAAQLSKLGLYTVKDLLYFFPRAYENRSEILLIDSAPLDVPVATVLTVATPVRTATLKRGLSLSKFKAFDDSGALDVVFFNSPYVKDVFTVGATFRFWGKLSLSGKRLQLSNPKFEPVIDGLKLPDFVPVYPLTEGITSKFLDKLVRSVLDEAVGYISDPVPTQVRTRHNLIGLKEAIVKAHVPTTTDDLSLSMRRLAFDELLKFGMSIALSSQQKRVSRGIKIPPCNIKPLLALLPYELTASQKSTVNDIYKDMVIGDGGEQIPAMSRIVVGDVGSGKTVCAAIAMYICASSGIQTALMAPTEILAKQHYNEISELFAKLGIGVELLLGQTTQKEKNRIYGAIESGKVSVVIGTHALISEKVSFKNLGLIVTDEQHRFGVAQRSVLKERSESAHILVMSATPIPRTLALTMYGDLDVSRITELPRGRQKIDTFVVDEAYRIRLCDFINKQIIAGGQCYVICPAIEAEGDDALVPLSISAPFDTSTPPLKNVIEHTEQLRTMLPNVRIEYLHGKMKSADKNDIMNRFASGDIDVLVSTTVIEVGINVPNASVMVIENAERFGLAQLHQLRGRVGRGTRKSYCILMSDHKSEKTRERLNVLKNTADGFEIAERDLALRGPGDLFSRNSDDMLRQSGGFDFKFAKLCDDATLLENAFAEAKRIVGDDPDLNSPDHAQLKSELIKILKGGTAIIS